MFQEALEYLVDLAKDANGIKSHRLSGRRTLVRCGSTAEIYDDVPAPKEIRLKDLDSFSRIANDGSNLNPACYVDASINAIVLYPDNDKRDDRVILELKVSPIYKAFLKCADWQTPKEISRLLRLNLVDAIEDSTVLPAISKIDFKRMSGAAHNNGRTSESMGRDVEMKVQTSDGKMPEVIVFDIAEFSNPEFVQRFKIRCLLEFDMENERIAIKPIGDERERFEHASGLMVLSRVKEAVNVPVFNGWCNVGFDD